MAVFNYMLEVHISGTNMQAICGWKICFKVNDWVRVVYEAVITRVKVGNVFVCVAACRCVLALSCVWFHNYPQSISADTNNFKQLRQ